MATPRKIVYVDTNAIIEATRTGCLKAILNQYDVRTVEEVRRESLRVPKNKKPYVKVDESLFRSQVSVAAVNEADVLRAAVKAHGLMALDMGERDLLAHVAGLKDTNLWILTTADRAAVRTACALGIESKLISLEELATGSGQKPKLSEWFTKTWLGKVRTEYLLDGI